MTLRAIDGSGNAVRIARVARVAAVAVAAWLLGAVTVAAQAAGDPSPYRGLFGGSDVPVAQAPAARRAAAWDAGVTVYGLVESDAAPSAGRKADGSHGAAEVTLAAARRRRRLDVQFRAGSQVRQYGDSRGIEADQQWAALAVEAKLSRRNTFRVAARGTYAPIYELRVPLAGQPQPGAADVSAPGLGVNVSGLRTASAAAGASLTRRVGRHTTAEAALDLTRVSFLDRGTAVATSRGSARLSHEFRSGPEVRLRYEYVHVASQLTDGPLVVVNHEADLGAVFSPARLPNTQIAVGLTPTLMQRRTIAGASSPQGPPEATDGLRLGASAHLAHRFSRALRATAGYQRALYSDEGYVQPVFVQTASAGLEARLSRRLQASATGSYSTGASNAALSRAATGGFGYAARVEYKASASTRLFAEWQRVATTMAHGAEAPRLDRRSVRLGVSLAPWR